ncbi:hypothetical protein RYX36_006635 [Vicia faba]
MDRKYSIKILAAIERKATKYKSKVTTGITSAPPKNNIKERDDFVGYEGAHAATKIPDQYALSEHHTAEYVRKIYQPSIMRLKNGFPRLKKNLFFLPEDEDDNDFFLNFHPSSNIGYEASYTVFVIHECIKHWFGWTLCLLPNDIVFDVSLLSIGMNEINEIMGKQWMRSIQLMKLII